jgi:polysaccharide biosynthesis/export protein
MKSVFLQSALSVGGAGATACQPPPSAPGRGVACQSAMPASRLHSSCNAGAVPAVMPPPRAAGLLVFLFAFFCAALVLSAQTAPPPPAYVLGPQDQISIQALDIEELGGKTYRIDVDGFIRLPLVGRFKATGLTVPELEAEISQRLGQFVLKPDVSVSIVEFRSQPVSVIGSVKNPGVYQLQGSKTLVEILSLAGGLANDAGYTVKITRRLDRGKIPIANAVLDPSGAFYVAEVALPQIMGATRPAENIVICADDVVSIPRAEMVYVVGQVTRAGGFVLQERETLSALKALSLAGGLGPSAAPQNARILRPAPAGGNRGEIAVDLKKILAGQTSDVPLQPEDILFVPTSGPKKAMARAVEAAIQITTGLAVYGRY